MITSPELAEIQYGPIQPIQMPHLQLVNKQMLLYSLLAVDYILASQDPDNNIPMSAGRNYRGKNVSLVVTPSPNVRSKGNFLSKGI